MICFFLFKRVRNIFPRDSTERFKRTLDLLSLHPSSNNFLYHLIIRNTQRFSLRASEADWLRHSVQINFSSHFFYPLTELIPHEQSRDGEEEILNSFRTPKQSFPKIYFHIRAAMIDAERIFLWCLRFQIFIFVESQKRHSANLSIKFIWLCCSTCWWVQMIEASNNNKKSVSFQHSKSTSARRNLLEM